jgi:hypothetical protein
MVALTGFVQQSSKLNKGASYNPFTNTKLGNAPAGSALRHDARPGRVRQCCRRQSVGCAFSEGDPPGGESQGNRDGIVENIYF